MEKLDRETFKLNSKEHEKITDNILEVFNAITFHFGVTQ